MDSYSNRNLTAFFDDRSSRDAAVAQLRQLGITDASVRVTGGEDYVGRDYHENKGFWRASRTFSFHQKTAPRMQKACGVGDIW